MVKFAACPVCVSGDDPDCPRCFGEARQNKIEDAAMFVLVLLGLVLILVFK